MATASIRLDQSLIDKAEIMSKALSRTTPKQIEHWAKIGEMMEGNPKLSYQVVIDKLIKQTEKDREAVN